MPVRPSVSVCLYARPRGSTGRVFLKLDVWVFTIMHLETLNMATIGRQCPEIYTKTKVCFTLLTATYIQQQYRQHTAVLPLQSLRYYIVDSDVHANNTKDMYFLGFITTMFTRTCYNLRQTYFAHVALVSATNKRRHIGYTKLSEYPTNRHISNKQTYIQQTDVYPTNRHISKC